MSTGQRQVLCWGSPDVTTPLNELSQNDVQFDSAPFPQDAIDALRQALMLVSLHI